MYLTKIPLNKTSRKFMIALNNPNIFHGAIENSFKGERKRRLWRTDCINGNYFILLLSEDIPDLTEFCDQFSCDKSLCVTKSYDGLLQRTAAGQRLRFRLVANPTVSVSSGNSKRGKVLACVKYDQQKKWLIKKSAQCGFSVAENSFDILGEKWIKIKEGKKNNLTLFAVIYEGILEVTDKEAFVNALTNGIGREKAYGMGLLTVMK